MRLFGRRKRVDHGKPQVTYIPGRCWKDPALDAGVDAVEEGHLLAGTALLRECRDDPEKRAQRVEALGGAAVGHSGHIAGLLEEETDPRDAADILLWLGSTLIREAWKIRGGGWAETVGRDRFKLFFATLAEAREPLLASAHLFPEDPVPWVCLQSFAMGSQLDRADKDEIWRNIIERCPTIFPGHWGRLQILSDKWGGSHEEMFDFARTTARTAPSGHPLVAMLPLAHAEYLLRERMPLLDEGSYKAFVRFSVDHYSVETVAELKEASERWLSGGEEHPRDIEAHHLFGGVFADCGDDDAARLHLGRIGDRFMAVPWDYFGTGTAMEEFRETMERLELG
ncbi:hypothetical protein ACQEU5_16140 [Marinactinospora thermotolerans]|uniref:DUF4034 domain-containing protein n=1 Tax=Marinactinospora thermotolerans DSM 45154 TaxID=1122192 RepID=A0A1T4SMN7_9ACTN|nr:hypothetical protein [Marinactinospora thermotolerans]SKA29457.1 hypothetical protein SAMN02745673_03717 [Marinactinospora thermotolerans DSM 45154]